MTAIAIGLTPSPQPADLFRQRAFAFRFDQQLPAFYKQCAGVDKPEQNLSFPSVIDG